ncbi:MAG: hypothetical protein HRT74_03690 [Flavobacteriales bacterium]|nr:hypothetical protein [Flavobacteriales bacterium]
MDNIGRTIGSYVLPMLLFSVGLTFAIIYLMAGENTAQPLDLLVSALTLMVVGVLTIPAILVSMKQSAFYVFLGIGVLVTIFLGYRITNSINEAIEYQEAEQRYQNLVVQRLKDVREIQKAYFDVNGMYSSDVSALKRFTMEKNIPQPYQSGTLDTLKGTEAELAVTISKADIDSVANSLGLTSAQFEDKVSVSVDYYVIRDTTYASLYDLKFSADARKKDNLKAVNLDEIFISPNSGNWWCYYPNN